MSNDIEQIRILLASPGNLGADRQIVREVVDTIGQDGGRRSGFHAGVPGCETHSPEIMFYFSNQSSGLRDTAPDQLKLVIEFKQKITKRGVDKSRGYSHTSPDAPSRLA